MNTISLPVWLTTALVAYKARLAEFPDLPVSAPAAGDFRFCTSPDGKWRRLVLVCETECLFVRVLLCSPFTEMAAAADYLVKNAMVYDVIVESDMTMTVWTWQLDSAPEGRLDESTTALLHSVEYPKEGLTPAGIPARDSRDPRWNWKIAEFEEVAPLDSDCFQFIMGE